MPGVYNDCTLEKITCINRAGIRSVVMTTISGTNIDEVPGIIDAVVAAGANVFAFARYCPTSEKKEVGIAPARYRKLLADCDAKFRAYEAAGCQTCFNKKDHLWTLYDYETGAFQIPDTVEDGVIYGGCNCGNCHLTILPTGDVYACRRVQALGHTRYKEMIRLSGRAVPVPQEEQARWIETIFSEQPYLANVYPGDSRGIGIVFVIRQATIEYFNLGVRPIFRETYSVNGGQAAPKGYRITDACIGCGRCGLGRCKHPPPHTARQCRLPNHKRRAGPAGL